jgi:L-iditol 2-dehydrogenase
MKVARYIGNGEVAIVEEAPPTLPEGGLVVRTEASGLCSGELMDWYMDRKIPHVLGHEVSGTVVQSEDERFPVGSRVFPHHHAACLECDACRRGAFVHCEQWRSTRLAPGGMAELFGVAKANLQDTHRIDDLRAEDAALIEPLACVAKSIRLAGAFDRPAVIGLGVMGLMHLLALGQGTGFDLNPARVRWALDHGLDAQEPSDEQRFDVVFVCPGSQAAFDFALAIAMPGATIVMFAPLPPGESLSVPPSVYFNDLKIVHSYSCALPDTVQAIEWIREGRVRAEQVVSDFIAMDELPEAYKAMKQGKILKPMVLFPSSEANADDSEM